MKEIIAKNKSGTMRVLEMNLKELDEYLIQKIAKKIRKCYRCGIEIKECMGSTSYPDYEKAMDGKLSWDKVRELCGKCVLKRKEKN